MIQEIKDMLAAKTFAVVGASRDTRKYGYLVYRSLKAAGKVTYAINPVTDQIDGNPAYPNLSTLPVIPDVAVMVVPASVTKAAVTECSRLGIRNVWMQPGAESAEAVVACRASGISVISGGSCLMVLLKTRRFTTP